VGAVVWLASYPKSGNTWMRLFLHNLLRPKETAHDINEIQDLTPDSVAQRWYGGLIERPLDESSLEAQAGVRAAAQERIAAAAAGLVFAKTHAAYVTDLGYPSINSAVTAGAIYIVRNPLDVAVSYAHHIGVGIDRTIALMNTRERRVRNKNRAYEPVGSWSENVSSWTRKSHSALIVVRYEDMLERPEETFGKLADFLLARPSRPELLAAIEKSSFRRLREQEEAHGFQEQPTAEGRFFRAGKAGGWKERLSPDQVAAIVAHHREQMARFNYLPEGA
jgi:hypothetical protein